jgi:hypothetical protein
MAESKQSGKIGLNNIGWTPIPDPTVLTTQQLQREIATSRELVEASLNGIVRTLETRLDGMDKVLELIQTCSDRIPKEIEDRVKQLQFLHEEKFNSIKTQFAERDTRAEQTTSSSKVAVDAALQAAKEAVGEQNRSNAAAITKSEGNFTKQIEQLGTLISANQKGADDKIDDIKSRLLVIESTKVGGNAVWGYVVTGIFILLGSLAIVVAIVVKH